MVDYETRTYGPRFSDQQNGRDNVPIPPHTAGYYSSFEDETLGGGDQLFDLECRLATSLSKELLSALEGPTQRPLPDFERNKVACLKNTILELKRENDALHQELWRVGRSKLDEDDRKRWSELPRSAGGHEPNEPSPHGSERDVACQTAARSLRGHDGSRESVPGSTEARPGKKHAQVSSHSKCVDWLKRRKSPDGKCDRLHLVRLALRQLYELADRALSPRVSSSDGCSVQCPEDNIGEDEKKEPSCTGAPSSEVEQLRLQLERLQRSTDRLKRRREEQAMLLRQKEIQLKALQLQMQTERASSLAGQSAEMEEKLQNAVEQLEKRYRGLVKDAFDKGDSKRSSRPASLNEKHSREESGT